MSLYGHHTIQGRRVGFARGGANMFGVELDMMADMGEGSNLCLYRGPRLKMVQYMRLDD